MTLQKLLTVNYTGNIGTATFAWSNDMGLPIVNSTQNPATLQYDAEQFLDGNITCAVTDSFCTRTYTTAFDACPDIFVSPMLTCSELMSPMPPVSLPYAAEYTKIKFNIVGLNPTFVGTVRVSLQDIPTYGPAFNQKAEFSNSLTPTLAVDTTATLTYIAGTTYTVEMTIDGLRGTDGIISGPIQGAGASHTIQIYVDNGCNSTTSLQTLYIPRTENCLAPPF